MTGKPILHSDIRWPMALQEFVRTGGGPFDSTAGSDNREGVSAEFQDATMPVSLLTLLENFAVLVPAILWDGSFHMENTLGARSRSLDHDLAPHRREILYRSSATKLQRPYAPDSVCVNPT